MERQHDLNNNIWGQVRLFKIEVNRLAPWYQAMKLLNIKITGVFLLGKHWTGTSVSSVANPIINKATLIWGCFVAPIVTWGMVYYWIYHMTFFFLHICA